MKLRSYRSLFQTNQLLIGQRGKFAAQEHEGNYFLHEELFHPFTKFPIMQKLVEITWCYSTLQSVSKGMILGLIIYFYIIAGQ